MTQEVPNIFDRRALRVRRARASAKFERFDFLHRMALEIIEERLAFLRPSGQGMACVSGARAPFARLTQTAIHADLVQQAAGTTIVFDEEALPFGPETLSHYISVLTLHTVNDLPGALIQIRRSLMPNGRFLGVLFGPQTLQELRHNLLEAELEQTGGASPRVHPFIDVKDAGALLQRAGFQEPVADLQAFAVTYTEPMRLLRDLQGMGETNILANRRKSALRRDVLNAALSLYSNKNPTAGGVSATFEFLFISGKAPS